MPELGGNDCVLLCLCNYEIRREKTLSSVFRWENVDRIYAQNAGEGDKCLVTWFKDRLVGDIVDCYRVVMWRPRLGKRVHRCAIFDKTVPFKREEMREMSIMSI